MSPALTRRRLLVGLAVDLALLLLCASVVQVAAQPQAAEDTSASLTVLVQTLAVGGAAPARGVRPQAPSPMPAAGAVVHVRSDGADASSDMEQLSDAQGMATFALADGTYWVYLPLMQTPDLSTSGAIAVELPDGTRVLDWAEVDVVAGQASDATLTVVYPLP